MTRCAQVQKCRIIVSTQSFLRISVTIYVFSEVWKLNVFPGIDDDEDVDQDLLTGIYERVKAQEFRPGVDHVTQVMKVEQTIVGNRKPVSCSILFKV